MIDFKGLDKTQINFVKRDCPDDKILDRICINKFIDTNPILNNVISDVIANSIGISSPLPKEIDDDPRIQNVIKNYYGISACKSLTPENLLSFIKDNKFNNKAHRTLLTEIFGNKVHNELFMTNLQFVISRILYAILYV